MNRDTHVPHFWFEAGLILNGLLAVSGTNLCGFTPIG